MKYMLDTNICSYIIKHRPFEVLTKFRTLHIEDCCISSVACAELKYWVARNRRLNEKSQNQEPPKINAQMIDNFIAHLLVAEFDLHAAEIYGEIRDDLEARGVIVGNADLLIGAHAISLNVTLVTNNIKDFVNFPSIQLENWVAN